MAAFLVSTARLALVGTCRALLSLRSDNLPPASGRPRIFAANHVSHADFVALWTGLDPATRAITRPVAGADYWEASGIRSWLIHKVFRGVLVERSAPPPPKPSLSTKQDGIGPTGVGQSGAGPEESAVLTRLAAPLKAGENLILFPEGTRNLTDAKLLRLRSGIYNLLGLVPEAEVVPLWITHMDRILPKGALVPVPLNCRLSFGPPLERIPGEERAAFLERLSAAILACEGAR